MPSSLVESAVGVRKTGNDRETKIANADIESQLGHICGMRKCKIVYLARVSLFVQFDIVESFFYVDWFVTEKN